MAEIQRPGGAELEGIARTGNVVHVQFGAAIDQSLHGRRLELPQTPCLALDALEEILVADQRHLHGLDITGPLVPRRKRREQLKIVYYGKRRRKGADEILFTERVNAVLDANARIVLAESCGGNPYVPQAAVRRGRRQANHVQQRSAPHPDDIGMTIDVVAINLRMDL